MQSGKERCIQNWVRHLRWRFFVKIVSQRCSAGSFFHKKIYLRCLSMFWMFLCETITPWKVSKYGVFSGSYFPAFGLKYLSIFSPNVGKYGPEKTLYFDTFHAVNIRTNFFLLYKDEWKVVSFKTRLSILQKSMLKKWSFPSSISSVNAVKSAGNCGFDHIYRRNT